MNPSSVSTKIRRKKRKDVWVLSSLALTSVLALTVYALGLRQIADTATRTDFALFHYSAQNLLEGKPLYEPLPTEHPLRSGTSTGTGLEDPLPNLNPPFQTLVFSPLGLLDTRTAFIIWTTLSLFCGLLAAILIGLRGSGASDRVLSSLVMTNLLVYYFPTLMSVLMGQWPLVAFLFLTLAWLAWREGKLSLAGSILGALAGIKLFFGAFLLFFLARKEWRAAIGFSVAGLTTVLLSALASGPDSILEYLGVLQGVDWFSDSWNASGLGFFKRIFGESGNDPLFRLPILATVLGRACGLLGVVLLVIMARRGMEQEQASDRNDLAFSSCIVLMLLISPLGWIYYFPFLLIPLVVIWRVSRKSLGGTRLQPVVILAWLLSTTPKLLVTKDALGGEPALILGWAGAYFYALVLLTVLLWKLQSRSSGSLVTA